MLIYQYRPAACIKVTGEDAAGYLQGQFTNELRRSPGAAVYGLWLNQKGKVLADSHVLRLGEDEFYVVATNSPAAVILPRLEEYIVADDVVLTDETPQFHGLAVSGPDGGEEIRRILGAAPAPGQFLRNGEMLIIPGRRVRGENYELIGPENSIREAGQKLLAAGSGATAAGEMEWARILDGMPSIPPDLGPGDLPNEGGLEDAAISFTKGCYLGQEVMARLKNMGQVRRRLHVIRGSGKPPEPLDAVYQGARKAGQIRSVTGRGDEFAALAMLSLVNLDPSAGLGLVPDAAPTARIVPHG